MYLNQSPIMLCVLKKKTLYLSRVVNHLLPFLPSYVPAHPPAPLLTLVLLCSPSNSPAYSHVALINPYSLC